MSPILNYHICLRADSHHPSRDVKFINKYIFVHNNGGVLSVCVRSGGPGPRWQIELKSGLPITRQRTPGISRTPPFPHRKCPSPDLELISQTPS